MFLPSFLVALVVPMHACRCSARPETQSLTFLPTIVVVNGAGCITSPACAGVLGGQAMRKLTELSEVEREVVAIAEVLTDAFGRLGTMEADGVGEVLSLLQHA